MVTRVQHPTLAERKARGVEARDRALPSSHKGWEPAPGRPDPVAPIEEQNRRRDADLVPVRHGRMMASPFTFYRGAAMIMATDLATTPNAGLGGWTLARAHARSGDPVAIAASLGDDDSFDRSITNVARRYAEQNERDYAALIEAIRTSRIQAVRGL